MLLKTRRRYPVHSRSMSYPRETNTVGKETGTNTEVNPPRKASLNNLPKLYQATTRYHRDHKVLLRGHLRGLLKAFPKAFHRAFHKAFHKAFLKGLLKFPKVIPKAIPKEYLPKGPPTRIIKFPHNRCLPNSMATVSTASTSHNRSEITLLH